MLPLLLAGLSFLFLAAGSVVFVLCLLVPAARKYALSAALWCAMWGPCTVGLMLLAGLGLVATAFITRAGDVQTFHVPSLVAAFGWGYFAVGIVVTVFLATGAAFFHQFAIQRLTYALFRIYAATVSAGIGSVFGWCLGWWMMTRDLHGYVWPAVWGICMLALIGGFGVAAFRRARGLRGNRPERFAWVSPAEFAGE